MLRRKPLPGDASDPGADHLDRGHQRVGEHHGPEHVEAELRARLGVGGYAAGIIVRRAGDQSRPQFLEQRGAAQSMNNRLHQDPASAGRSRSRSACQDLLRIQGTPRCLRLCRFTAPSGANLGRRRSRPFLSQASRLVCSASRAILVISSRYWRIASAARWLCRLIACPKSLPEFISERPVSARCAGAGRRSWSALRKRVVALSIASVSLKRRVHARAIKLHLA